MAGTALSSGGDALVTATRVLQNGDVGIFAESGLEVVDCVVSANASDGIRRLSPSAGDMTIARSRVRWNGGNGIVLGNDASVTDSVIVDNGGAGVSLGSSCALRGSVVLSNDGDGVQTGTDCTVVENLITENGGDGIEVLPPPGTSARGSFVRNVLGANNGYGLRSRFHHEAGPGPRERRSGDPAR